MARKYNQEKRSGKTILLVDDNHEYLEATRLILEREGHEVISCTNGADALFAVRTRTIDLLLIDYVMPGMNGEEVIVEIRKFNAHLQIILQTGYANENPPRELLQRLDIQGYYDKSDGPDRLLLWTDVGLKSAYSIQLLTKSRLGLNYILSATPEMYKIQPLGDLLRGILIQISGLLGAANSFLAILPPNRNGSPVEGFLAMAERDGAELKIRAGVGKYAGLGTVPASIPAELSAPIRRQLEGGVLGTTPDMTIVPLKIGDMPLGVVYIETGITTPSDAELMRVFASQASAAILNAQLYEMATIDTLTGVFVRRFFDQWVIRELKNSLRSGKPLALVMLDMDDLKVINDRAGHKAGDRALVDFASALKDSSRSSDFVCRYGGDEFSLLLPNSTIDGTELVIARLHENIRSKSFQSPDGVCQLSASVGVAIFEPSAAEIDFGAFPDYFARFAAWLQHLADMSLYEAKAAGKNGTGEIKRVGWIPPDELPLLDEPAVP
jgi:diguanylate cyclase (GGDEF)-like protein